MADLPDFQRRQYAFAAHIRNPAEVAPPPGIEDRRMAIYRELFLSNLSSLLGATYPVTHKLIGNEAWTELVRGFMRRHESHTPLFLEVPREFLDYLSNEREPVATDPPFMLELVHYEWVELALSVAEDVVIPDSADRNGDLLAGAPIVSPLAWPLSYQYPVHRINLDFQPQQAPAEPTFLVVYRRLDDELGFLELNAVTARMLELLDGPGETRTGREVLEALAVEIEHPNPEVVVQGGLETLEKMCTLDIVLGTRQAAAVGTQ